LLEWTTNEPERGFDGVRYFSTSVGKYADHPEAAANSVFPVRTKAASGFCSRLREKFHLSPPVAWSILEHVDVPPVPRESGDWTVDGSLVLNEVPVRYAKTDFYECELKLDSWPGVALELN